MDPRERADAALARARARGAFVVTPEDAISPMDAANTLQIPRVVVSSLDDQRPDETTMVVGHPLADPQPTQRQPSPRKPQPYPPSQQQQQQQQPPAPPRQAPPPEQEQDPQPEGMVPTVQKKPSPRPSLSQRLDGTL